MPKQENQNIEFKEQWRDDALKTICAFANAGGGVVYIGIDDNGKSVAVKDIKKLMEDIPNKIRAVLGIVADVSMVKKAGNGVMKISVSKYSAPISYHGSFYSRSGTTTAELKGAALTRFLLSCSGVTWDMVVEPRASLKDIDVKTVRQFQQMAKKRFPFIAREKNTLLVLEKLNLLEKGKLKRAAILLFSKNPRKYFTSAFVQVGRFISESEVISTDVIEGNLFEQVEKVIEVLRIKYLENRFYYEGLRRNEDMIYPEEALREAVINALIHRDYLGPHTQLRVYENELWLWNAGELPEKITFEKLKKSHLSCPRNELLADVFFKAGFIESWGRGTLKILDQCRKWNLPEPEFSELTGGFLVTFTKAAVEESKEKGGQKGGAEKGAEKEVEKGAEKLTSQEQTILSLIRKNSRISKREIIEQGSLGKKAVDYNLEKLKKKNVIKRVGPDKGGHWKVLK